MLKDYKSYVSVSLGKGPENAQTSVSHLVEIWSKVVVKMGLEPNFLKDGDQVDDLWFHNPFNTMETQLESCLKNAASTK